MSSLVIGLGGDVSSASMDQSTAAAAEALEPMEIKLEVSQDDLTRFKIDDGVKVTLVGKVKNLSRYDNGDCCITLELVSQTLAKTNIAKNAKPMTDVDGPGEDEDENEDGNNVYSSMADD